MKIKFFDIFLNLMNDFSPNVGIHVGRFEVNFDIMPYIQPVIDFLKVTDSKDITFFVVSRFLLCQQIIFRIVDANFPVFLETAI